jgi:hypothetical protein
MTMVSQKPNFWTLKDLTLERLTLHSWTNETPTGSDFYIFSFMVQLKI